MVSTDYIYIHLGSLVKCSLPSSMSAVCVCLAKCKNVEQHPGFRCVHTEIYLWMMSFIRIL